MDTYSTHSAEVNVKVISFFSEQEMWVAQISIWTLITNPKVLALCSLKQQQKPSVLCVSFSCHYTVCMYCNTFMYSIATSTLASNIKDTRRNPVIKRFNFNSYIYLITGKKLAICAPFAAQFLLIFLFLSRAFYCTEAVITLVKGIGFIFGFLGVMNFQEMHNLGDFQPTLLQFQRNFSRITTF